jgi:CheY-like chemotaxis protein
VLVVEDEFLVRDVLVQELIDAGLRVIEADTGEAAVQLIARGEPVEVLFTDIRLPGAIDGWEIAQRARAAFPQIHVIYASGYSLDRQAQLPDSTYLKKPYLPASVVETIRQRCPETCVTPRAG